MQKYRIMTRATIVGSVEATNEKEAVEKFVKEVRSVPVYDINQIYRAVLDSNITPILKAYRENNNMSRLELANKLGMARMSLYRIERHKAAPSRITMQKLREAGII